MFRAVNGRIAIDFTRLSKYIALDSALKILYSCGFKSFSADMIPRACSVFATAMYKLGAKSSEAPYFFDCSSLTKWLYGYKGIWIPRKAIDQYSFGKAICGVIEEKNLMTGDLVFASGPFGYYHEDPQEAIGHVAIVSRNPSVVIHASPIGGVSEESLTSFKKRGEFRGAVRIIANPEQTGTFSIPQQYEIETENDVKWLLLTKVKEYDILQPVLEGSE
jgi:hypothetical protein